MRNRRESGEGRIGCIFGLILLLIAGLIAYKMIPVKVKTSDMRETVQNEARSAGQHNDASIMKSLLTKAESLQLPVTDKDIAIVRVAGEIRVDVDYTVPVQFPGFVYQWHFHHHAENPIF